MRSFRVAHFVAACLLAAFPALGSLRAQDCSGTSIGATPLIDLGAGTYLGHPGGLYPNGQNVPPPAHAAAGAAAAANVTPRDANGVADPNGRIVVVSIGMSNTTQEFSQFVQLSDADPNRAAPVTVVDGAQGGQDAEIVADPNAVFWSIVDQRLAAAGVTPQQVQVAWLLEAVAGPQDPFPQHALHLRDLLAAIARNLKARYPNLAICYVSSRIYAGYATSMLNPEPYAYESGFAVKWLIEDQIAGDPSLNSDPAHGAVHAPWLAWGPYTWADGLTPRSDGLVWLCSDFQADGTHPGPTARQKVADMLNTHFTTDPTARPWYVGTGGILRAAVRAYGVGCPGTSGVPSVRTNGTPWVGNQGFRLGVTDARASSPATLFTSLGAAQLPIGGGCALAIDPLRMFGPIVLGTNASGSASVVIPVPGDPALIGVSLFTQWWIDDPQGLPLPPLAGIALTRGAELRIGVP